MVTTVFELGLLSLTGYKPGRAPEVGTEITRGPSNLGWQ